MSLGNYACPLFFRIGADDVYGLGSVGELFVDDDEGTGFREVAVEEEPSEWY